MSEENIKKAVEKFYEIRNIPYHIALNYHEEHWQCESKNRKLAEELENLGYKTRQRIGLMRWSEQNIPKTVLENISYDDESSHLFLEVIPPEQKGWVTVDCTLNPELKKAGFPVAEWDGKKSTEVGFKCYELIPAEENGEYLSGINYEDDMRRNYQVYDAFNKYCDSF